MTTTHKFFWIITIILLSFSCKSIIKIGNDQMVIEPAENIEPELPDVDLGPWEFESDYNDSILRILKKNDPYAPEGVRFDVEDVTICDRFSGEKDAKIHFEEMTMREILYMPDEHAQKRIVPSSDLFSSNALLETVRDAYHGHHPLALSPDVIWLTICQGMSIHINLNFKSLEGKIYKNGHPDAIHVRVDTVAFDSTQWSVAVDSLAQHTRRYTDPYFYEAFVPQFSTTSPIDHVAYQITLLHAQQKGFSYSVESGCGIPWIVLRGTTEDWELIKKKLSILNSLGMKKWKSSLLPIIDQFIAASKGKADKSFWANIYKDKTSYGTYAITGWIHQLFPYITNRNDSTTYLPDWGISVDGITYQPNPFLNKKVTSSDNLTSDYFPSSILKVPFVWHNHYEGRTDSLYLWSGIWGTKQYGDKTLEPFISWVLTKGEYKKGNYPVDDDEE
ncbi:MAG: DUF4419 domain-containing protein [Paludibacteraceae bacterium]|nr:DUF4419 domain-containing protein [Paludibacteraceae bacterium]